MEVGSRKTEVDEMKCRKMKFKFEKMIIWQKAMEFGEDINKLFSPDSGLPSPDFLHNKY